MKFMSIEPIEHILFFCSIMKMVMVMKMGIF
jgi:hypothetical protein